MKNLYTKNKIYPSAPPPPISAHQALLPATILTLTTSLSPQDREVLAYLISCSTSSDHHHHNHRKPAKADNDSRSKTISSASLDHGRTFGCNCFRCYMSFWILWDASPNRELIHEIIEAYEDDLHNKEKKKRNNVKVKKQKKSSRVYNYMEEKLAETVETCQPDNDESIADEVMKMEMEKGSFSSLRKVFSLIGEKIWDARSK